MGINWSEGSGKLSAGGKELEWACFGTQSPDLPVVVMLHEGLGCLALWRDFPQSVAESTGLPVFVYSRAGHGRSEAGELPRPLDYMTREAVDVLPDVLDAIGSQSYILLGHSDGATIAAEYAGRIEDFRIRGLILMAPHFFTEPMGLAEIADSKTTFENSDLRDRMAKYHLDAGATFHGWNDAWLDPGFVEWNVGEVIDYWRIPCLVIQGNQDQYGTKAQVTEVETRSYAPVEVAMIDDCRHSPHLDQPGITLAVIHDFTARLVRIEAEIVEVA